MAAFPFGSPRTAVFAACGLGIGALAWSALYVVPAGHRAVVFSRLGGVKDRVFTEGLNVAVPGFEYPQMFDVRTSVHKVRSTTGTHDLQQVDISMRLLCRPIPERLPWLYSNYGTGYLDRILPGISYEVIKATLAQYDAGELVTRRDHVSGEIREAMTRRADNFGLILDDVALTHTQFSPEFARAIESKQVAEQDAERAKFVVLCEEEMRRAAVVRAEGEAEAAHLISEALKRSGTALLELRRIQAAQEIASTLSASSNVTYLPSGHHAPGSDAGQGVAGGGGGGGGASSVVLVPMH